MVVAVFEVVTVVVAVFEVVAVVGVGVGVVVPAKCLFPRVPSLALLVWQPSYSNLSHVGTSLPTGW